MNIQICAMFSIGFYTTNEIDGGKMNSLVLFYSRKGNNKYLAQKIANDLECDIEELIPRSRSYLGLLISSMTKIGSANKKMSHNPESYDKIILCTPVWMGQLARPAYIFLKKKNNAIKKMCLVTCCGSYDDDKDTKFGYEKVFEKAREIMKEKLTRAFALPIGLALEKEKRKDANIMELKLSDANFDGEIKSRYENIIKNIKE
jgi:flavodoxin